MHYELINYLLISKKLFKFVATYSVMPTAVTKASYNLTNETEKLFDDFISYPKDI